MERQMKRQKDRLIDRYDDIKIDMRNERKIDIKNERKIDRPTLKDGYTYIKRRIERQNSDICSQGPKRMHKCF